MEPPPWLLSILSWFCCPSHPNLSQLHIFLPSPDPTSQPPTDLKLLIKRVIYIPPSIETPRSPNMLSYKHSPCFPNSEPCSHLLPSSISMSTWPNPSQLTPNWTQVLPPQDTQSTFAGLSEYVTAPSMPTDSRSLKALVGLPRQHSGKEPACQCRSHRRCRFNPWVGKNPLEGCMPTHSSILAWKIPWTEEPGRL